MKSYNIILLITDGHGVHTTDFDWGTKEYFNLQTKFEKMNLLEEGFFYFPHAHSPAASTIMSIESMLYGVLASKTRKKHWRKWPKWDEIKISSLTDFLAEKGYDINGFSYLLNSVNWIPSLKVYKPELYKTFPSKKADTHSHLAVWAALQDFFKFRFESSKPNMIIIHSIFIADFWNDIKKLLFKHNINYENTIFIFTADHYFPKLFGRQWLIGERDNTRMLHHSDLTESNINVPLFINLPNYRGRTINDVIAGYDILPTILDVLNIQDEWKGDLDGQSLLRMMIDQKYRPNPRIIRSDNLYPFQIGEKLGRVTALTDGRWKYVNKPDPESSYISYRIDLNWKDAIAYEEFYDLHKDKNEKNNLINSNCSSHQNEIKRFRTFLKQSSEEIIKFHINSMIEIFKEKPLFNLINEIYSEHILLLQTTHKEVYIFLKELLLSTFPNKNFTFFELDMFDTTFRIKRDMEYAPQDEIINNLKNLDLNKFELAIITSNVPLGIFEDVYDESQFPINLVYEITETIRYSNINHKIILGLNLEILKLQQKYMITKYLKKLSIRNIIRVLWEKYGKRMTKLLKEQQDIVPKIDHELADRILKEKEYNN